MATTTIRKNFELVSSGKVRDCYSCECLFFETSNRLSVFDRVIKDNVRFKGNMLNCISQQNKKLLESKGIETDIIEIDSSFFAENGFPAGRMSCAKKLCMLPIEFIVRDRITGSAWAAYQRGESYCGYTFPKGMRQNEKFDSPIVTPTTKASSGHDMPLTKKEAIFHLASWILKNNLVESVDSIKNIYKNNENLASKIFETLKADLQSDVLEILLIKLDIWECIQVGFAFELATKYINQAYRLSLNVFDILYQMCDQKDIMLVDSKFEFGLKNGRLVLGDEVGTPDSSRFAQKEVFKDAGVIVSLDKQIVRDYCKSIGFSGEPDQEIPEIPNEIWEKVTLTYINIAETLFGSDIVKEYLNS